MLNKLGIINDDGKISITNVTVFVFVCIAAFKELFSGVSIVYHTIEWKISSLDLSSSLPLLFSFLNYGHKRVEMNKILKDGE